LIAYGTLISLYTKVHFSPWINGQLFDCLTANVLCWCMRLRDWITVSRIWLSSSLGIPSYIM